MSLGNRLGLWLSRFAPGLARRMIRHNAAMFGKDPEGYMNAMAIQMPPPDRALLESESLRRAMALDTREAYRQGVTVTSRTRRWP